uniref:Uncharacterized protein n=2 Tax=Haptolina ericina TaxID=156174 RepID=A0A7S3FEQ2_9EUKA|mmetsp:Transcript_6677/g.14904  ORF Transcript_6677/g.14904 Transcript_6677/m.14904 type:complete len:144 (+) Transcript_6677:2109-2540(+)
MVEIEGVNPDMVDIYFFAVQTNPVDNNSVLAIFPLTAPPSACIMLAFSADGISFSRPVSLLAAPLGVRTEGRGGSGRLEFRSEDHPAAGMVLVPNDPSTLLVFIHHAVRGTTMRPGAKPHVRSYRLPVNKLRYMTRQALHSHR